MDAAFQLAICCTQDHGVAPFPAFHFCIWRKLACVLKTGSFSDALGVDNKEILDVGNGCTRFVGDGTSAVPPVSVEWPKNDVLATVIEFVNKLPSDWRSRMESFLSVLADNEHLKFVSNLAVTVASAFGNLIPEQLQRFGNSLVEKVSAAAHTGDGWHGVTTKQIEQLTGLADLSERKRAASTKKP